MRDLRRPVGLMSLGDLLDGRRTDEAFDRLLSLELSKEELSPLRWDHDMQDTYSACSDGLVMGQRPSHCPPNVKANLFAWGSSK